MKERWSSTNEDISSQRMDSNRPNSYEIRILEDGEYGEKLVEKLREEPREYVESKAPDQLAEVLEILLVLVDQDDLTIEELKNLRHEKEKNDAALTSKLFSNELRSERTTIMWGYGIRL